MPLLFVICNTNVIYVRKKKDETEYAAFNFCAYIHLSKERTTSVFRTSGKFFFLQLGERKIKWKTKKLRLSCAKHSTTRILKLRKYKLPRIKIFRVRKL